MKTVIITGGSAGIGFELSKQFAQRGFEIYWVTLLEEEAKAAKEQLLLEFPKTMIHYFIQDLSKANAAQKTYDWASTQNIEVDVMVNNAGIGTYGMSPSIPMEKELRMLELNVMSVYKLTRLFLKDMLARDKGTIINISSVASIQPIPRLAAYAATKAFVASYSQALNDELKDMRSKVKVMTVCPAAIKNTDFKVAAKMEKLKTFNGLATTTKEEVAADIWKAFQQGKPYLLTGARLRRLNVLTKLLPNTVVSYLMKREMLEE